MAMLDPEAWYEPLVFKPERFLNPGKEDDLSAFVAFGGGARLCVGIKLAQNLMRTCLMKLYREFKFELEPGQVPLQVETGLTMTPAHGIKLKVTRRP